jgi:amino acid adenylation domain-containing protein
MTAASADTVVKRFQEIVARFGSRPAIRQGSTITYEELDRRSDQMAAHLGDLSPEAAPVVGLALSLAPETVAAMLGVMKTGRAYVVIDPGAPVKRKQAIAEEMALEVVLGDRASEPWPGFSGRWIDSSAIPTEPIRSENFRSITSASRCCILQTSGTTGQPLGVEVSHASLLHTVDNYAVMAAIVPEDRFTMLTTPAYLAAHSAVLGALLNGACLLPFDVRTLGLAAMADWLEQEALTIYQSPPSLFRAFARQLPKGRVFPSLRFLRLGGEPVLLSDLELFREHFSPNAQFFNTFGISEAGGNVAYLRTDRESAFAGPLLPIGSPSEGQDVFLADDFGKPVPHGEVGEIVVRSEFLATGYYRRPELTARKFRTSADGRRELWTGDLGHMTPEGWLMHDGRKDDQVKILGHRVDVAGLEAMLHSIPDVREARVLPLRNSGKAEGLFAFVVPTGPAVTAGSIRNKLSELVVAPVLPRVLLLESLPLNAGGKIDRARLLQLAAESSSLSCPPRNETERELAGIWRSVLGVGDIGVYDNFFDCGGDSLTALSASSTIEERFDLPFSPWLFLDRPTIAQMGEYISARNEPRAFRRWLQRLDRQKAEQIVALRRIESPSQAPLFVCPGGWGHERELLVFASMLQHLPPDLPVYGLKQNFLANSIPVAESVDTIARNFLATIRNIQPKGPYRLLGECIAGVVVLELAHQLELAGDPAEKIILLDPRLPRTQPPDTGTESEHVSEKVRRYYQILTEATQRPCVRRVHVIGTEETEHMRRRLEQWNIFDTAQLEIVRVPGDHDSYLRQHGEELAREIALAILPVKKPSRDRALHAPV